MLTLVVIKAAHGSGILRNRIGNFRFPNRKFGLFMSNTLPCKTTYFLSVGIVKSQSIEIDILEIIKNHRKFPCAALVVILRIISCADIRFEKRYKIR